MVSLFLQVIYNVFKKELVSFIIQKSLIIMYVCMYVYMYIYITGQDVYINYWYNHRDSSYKGATTDTDLAEFKPYRFVNTG